jgi:hypothetical protein
LRTVQDSWGACTTRGTHYTPRWARMVETVQESWGGLTCLTFVHVPPRNTFTPRWAQDSWDSPGWWGWSHMSHIRCMYHPRNTFTPRWARIVERQSRIVGDGLTCLTFGACTIPKEHHTKGGPG